MNKVQKPHGHLNKCRESLQQNSAFLHDKNTEETRARRKLPQHHKGYI